MVEKAEAAVTKKAATEKTAMKPVVTPKVGAGKTSARKPRTLVKKLTSGSKKKLTFGKVMFRAFLWRGKFRFISKVELARIKKQKAAKLADLKSKGIKPVRKVQKKHRAPIVVKPIKGEKNGETRKIHLRRKSFYPTEKSPKKHRTRGPTYREHKRRYRPSLTPGTILILLAGVNKGKRVILLKTLPQSGLLLVTGPYLLNGVPLRRVQPGHVIATRTKLDLSKVTLPDKLTDKFFKRVVEKKKVKKGQKTVFVPKKKSYKPSQERKELQKVVDKSVLDVIKVHPDKKVLLAYLSAMFGLRNNQYPHRMQF